jgi:hypothetical protein
MTSIALVIALLVAPAAPDTVPDAGPDPAPADTVALAADAYLDATARALVERARARHDGLERAIEAYETTAREWVDVRARVMGRERLIHREEMVARIHWRRGEPAEVELLGGRSVTPVSDPEVEADRSGANLAFDPADIQRVLRLPGLGASADDEGGRFIIHPLAPASERHYRFRYAGETQVRLADGRVVRLLELQAIPRRSDPRLVRGSLWLESETYGIVRTVFRLARPLEVNLDLDLPRAATRTLGLGGGARGDLRVLAMEAALWEGRWWLPRWITMEGVGEIGALTFPIRWERSYDGFRVEGPDLPLAAEARPLFGEDSARGRCPPREERPEGTTCNCGPLGCVVARVTAPESDSLLIHSPELPPSIFRGGDGVLSAGERAELEAWAGAPPRCRSPASTRGCGSRTATPACSATTGWRDSPSALASRWRPARSPPSSRGGWAPPTSSRAPLSDCAGRRAPPAGGPGPRTSWRSWMRMRVAWAPAPPSPPFSSGETTPSTTGGPAPR